MVKEMLEKRLEVVLEEAFEKVKASLRKAHINPREKWDKMPYFKYNLTHCIVDYLAGRSNTPSQFERVLYSAVNKEPLKRVWYGICSTEEMPKEFLNSLTDWERIYFFSGRWVIREPNLTEPLPVLTAKHLKAGLESLYEHHFVRKAFGKYTRQLELPEDKEVRDACKRIIGGCTKPLTTNEQKPEKRERKLTQRQFF